MKSWLVDHDLRVRALAALMAAEDTARTFKSAGGEMKNVGNIQLERELNWVRRVRDHIEHSFGKNGVIVQGMAQDKNWHARALPHFDAHLSRDDDDAAGGHDDA